MRGHFPAETDAILESIGRFHAVDGIVLVPAFFDGGRITLNDVHYMIEGDNLVPVGLTPFAKDAHFGYESSNLVNWVIEKSKGAIDESRILSISLEDIREGGPQAVADKLDLASHGSVVIVNGIAIVSLPYPRKLQLC